MGHAVQVELHLQNLAVLPGVTGKGMRTNIAQVMSGGAQAEGSVPHFYSGSLFSGHEHSDSDPTIHAHLHNTSTTDFLVFDSLEYIFALVFKVRLPHGRAQALNPEVSAAEVPREATGLSSLK
ncbi:hypothetical protein KEM54_000321 [Ascosphaera aggregata]|nr:hypothetical protein KEM54_000321 [Ascosphaera aggregata]